MFRKKEFLSCNGSQSSYKCTRGGPWYWLNVSQGDEGPYFRSRDYDTQRPREEEFHRGLQVHGQERGTRDCIRV